MKITLLGTGTPVPDALAYGTATLVEAGSRRVLIDCGRGAVIRLSQTGLSVGAIDTVLLSHYHSDHYAGLFDLLMTGGIPHGFANRGGPLHVYGPPGIEQLAEGAWLAGQPDRDIRVADSEIDPEHVRLVPHELIEGTVFDEDGLRIEAILVDHGEFIRPAYAFRVEYGGRVFVHSHDTRYNENLIERSRGCDVLVHEVAAASAATLRKHPEVKVAIDHHATPDDVGRVFAEVRPSLALLTHLALLRPAPVPIEKVLETIGRRWDGPVVVAEDLMTILLGRSISVVPFHRGAK